MRLFIVEFDDHQRYFDRRTEADAFARFVGDGTVVHLVVVGKYASDLADFANGILRRNETLLPIPDEIETPLD